MAKHVTLTSGMKGKKEVIGAEAGRDVVKITSQE